jgi:hypothetical protein
VHERSRNGARHDLQQLETRRLGVRVFAWNIRQGGGARLSRIADALRRHDADILVLSEYRGGASGDRLRASLETLGYGYTTTLSPPPGRSGVLIAARFAFDDYGVVGGELPEPYRMVGVEFAAFHLVGTYMPNLLGKGPLLGSANRQDAQDRRSRPRDRGFQHLPSLSRRGGRDRSHSPLHGPDRRDRISKRSGSAGYADMMDDLKDTTTTEAVAEDWAKVKLPPRLTGLPTAVWITENDGYPHDVRVKVSTLHGGRGSWRTAPSIAVRPAPPEIMPGSLPAADAALVSRWIDLNRDLIIDYWNSVVDFDEVTPRLQQVQP